MCYALQLTYSIPRLSHAQPCLSMLCALSIRYSVLCLSHNLYPPSQMFYALPLIYSVGDSHMFNPPSQCSVPCFSAVICPASNILYTLTLICFTLPRNVLCPASQCSVPCLSDILCPSSQMLNLVPRVFHTMPSNVLSPVPPMFFTAHLSDAAQPLKEERQRSSPHPPDLC